jgi:Bacterial Ig-like domain (group 3)/Glycine rich protein
MGRIAVIILTTRCAEPPSDWVVTLPRPVRDRVRSRAVLLSSAVGVFAAVMLLGQSVAYAANPACPSAASSTTNSCTFAATGAEQTYTVPAGVSFVTISAVGAHGGFGNNFVQGGKGAAVTATVPVPAGAGTLYVEVGTSGGNDNLNGFGGFNGGGFSGDAGGGGGASDVRTCSRGVCTDLSVNDTRLVVAGGGGGGGSGAPGCGNHGGQAGDSSVSGPGAGGAGSNVLNVCFPGGNGGFGGTGGANGGGGAFVGAGGGGGYVGGGGGGEATFNGGGGGAGSSFWLSGATNTSMSEDTTGTSQIVITQASTTSTTISSSSSPSLVGGQVTYEATISPTPDGGTVAFEDGTATIPGCGSQPVDAATGKASCQLTYSSTGTHTITAVYSGDAAFVTSTSPPLTQQVVPGPPSAHISLPPDHQTFAIGQHVPTGFSCSEGVGGPGLASCKDSNGANAPSGTLDTSKAGTFTYAVTAISTDGQTSTASISYTVAAPPSVDVARPADGARYALGQVVHASYSCQEGASGPGLQSCSGPVASGAAIDTSTPGSHTFTVTARSKDGQSASRSVSYSVLAATQVRIGSVHATPLRRGCAVETGRDEREITAVSADATCRHLRLTLRGSIQSGGKLVAAAGGTVSVSYRVRLPRGHAAGGARVRVDHGRWRISLMLPAVNLDPVLPSYLITIRYSGDHNLQQASTSRRIRLEAERAGLHP